MILEQKVGTGWKLLGEKFSLFFHMTKINWQTLPKTFEELKEWVKKNPG